MLNDILYKNKNKNGTCDNNKDSTDSHNNWNPHRSPNFSVIYADFFKLLRLWRYSEFAQWDEKATTPVIMHI